jgi:hypothetical protein
LSSPERKRVSRVLFAFRISTTPSTVSGLSVSRSKKENKERGELKEKNVEWVLKQQKTKTTYTLDQGATKIDSLSRMLLFS